MIKGKSGENTYHYSMIKGKEEEKLVKMVNFKSRKAIVWNHDIGYTEKTIFPFPLTLNGI